MKSLACFACLGALALAGCATSATPPADTAPPAPPAPATPVSVSQPPAPSAGSIGDSDAGDRVVASVHGDQITMKQLMPALIKAHGLTTLLQLVELDLAKQTADKQGVTVTPADIQHERDVTLSRLFAQTDDKMQSAIEDAKTAHDEKRAKELQDELADQHAVLLTQFLDNQHIAESEFETAMEINAYLRKVAEPEAKKALTPDVLKRAFNSQYGERVSVRYIQLSNLDQVNEVKRRLAQGADFGDLARTMSENVASRELGGKLRPFSQKDTNLPQAFRDAAFALKVGEVSDPVECGDKFFLIKMDERLPPVAVKFEDVEGSLRQLLMENIVEQMVKQLRDQLGGQAIHEMQIDDPIMSRQYNERKEQQKAQVRDQSRIKADMDAEHHRLWDKINAATQPATQPAAAPALPATQP